MKAKGVHSKNASVGTEYTLALRALKKFGMNPASIYETPLHWKGIVQKVCMHLLQIMIWKFHSNSQLGA